MIRAASPVVILWGFALLSWALPGRGAEATSRPVMAEDFEAENVAIGEDLEVAPLANGVWLHVSYREIEGYGRVPANGLVVVSDGEAALLDTPWTDSQTRELVGWLKAELDVRVAVVVATHSHADCMGGLGAAHALGARSYALDATADFAKRDGSPVPEETFESERDIEVGSRRLELRFFGPGHTVDNTVVWIPDVQVLFAGDVLRSSGARALGNIREADLEGWPTTLDRLEREYGRARMMVPGHGAPGGPELIHHTRDLLAAPR